MVTAGFDSTMTEQVLGRREHFLISARDRSAFGLERVLITGAASSVGVALARQMAALVPDALTLVDSEEQPLAFLAQTLRRRFPRLTLRVVLGDISRGSLLRQAVEAAAPTVIYHAAGYRDATLTESGVGAVIARNVFATAQVMRAARRASARVVVVSSAQAARPTTVVGAAQRLAESVALSAASDRVRPVVVRLGTVIGPDSPVVHQVVGCLQEELPIPVSAPQTSHHLLSTEEAAHLVLKADLLGRSGEVCWLELGEPVRWLDVIERVRALAPHWGMLPTPIDVTGLDASEGRRVEALDADLTLTSAVHPRLRRGQPAAIDTARLTRVLRALRTDLQEGDVLAALRDLAAGVPGYHPSPTAWASALGHDGDVSGLPHTEYLVA